MPQESRDPEGWTRMVSVFFPDKHAHVALLQRQRETRPVSDRLTAQKITNGTGVADINFERPILRSVEHEVRAVRVDVAVALSE